MSLLDRVLAEPELEAAPPVLVDVGAAGGVPAIWRRIAPRAIGVGFEPDAREAAPLAAGQRLFRRWTFCPGLAVAEPPPGGRATLHLTRSPQCSSTLRPRAAALREWAFADFFEVVSTRDCPALTLQQALREQGLERIDWLKCDTQGTDARLFLSLPAAWRSRMLAVEFEPGLMDAYDDEDDAATVLTAMRLEPFWLAAMEVGRTPRGRGDAIARHLGAGAVTWYRRLAPGAPGWVNLCYLRDPLLAPEMLDRRALLLAWVFATLLGQHGQALTVAEAGQRQGSDALFRAMVASSVRQLRWAMWRGWPALLWRRIRRG